MTNFRHTNQVNDWSKTMKLNLVCLALLITSGMPGATLSECLQSMWRLGDHTCWHTAAGSPTVATQTQTLCSKHELCSRQGDSSYVCVVELVVHAQCLLETCVTLSRPCHTIILLTLTGQTDLEVSYRARWKLSSLQVFPCWRFMLK